MRPKKDNYINCCTVYTEWYNAGLTVDGILGHFMVTFLKTQIKSHLFHFLKGKDQDGCQIFRPKIPAQV